MDVAWRQGRCAYVYASSCRDQNKVLHSLELELEVVKSH